MIICDVMMPEMDGYALVDHVRKDDRTSWIPVLFFPPRVKAKIGLRVLTLERMSTWLSRLSQKNCSSSGSFSQTGIPPTAATPLMATTKAKSRFL